MARPSFFRVSTEALLHRRTGHGKRKGVGGGAAAAPPVANNFLGQSADDSGKKYTWAKHSTR